MNRLNLEPTRSKLRRRGAPPKPISARKPAARQSTRPMTPAMELFCERYLISVCAARAYRESHPGCTAATAETQGSRLLKDRRVSSEIQRRLAAVKARYRRDADGTLDEVASIAFADIRELFDCEGRLIPLDDLPRHVTAAIKKLRTREIKATDSNGTEAVVGRVVDVEFDEKLLALRLLGAHEGLFVERVEISRGPDFAELLREARERVIQGHHEKIDQTARSNR